MNIYLTKIAEEMGKKAKAHRKKVVKRNAEIQQKLKSFQKSMQDTMRQMQKQQTIAQDYETIHKSLTPQQATAILEETGPRFS
jgi:23S rRNA pseudoU1915 N3-methylase RlmH